MARRTCAWWVRCKHSLPHLTVRLLRLTNLLLHDFWKRTEDSQHTEFGRFRNLGVKATRSTFECAASPMNVLVVTLCQSLQLGGDGGDNTDQKKRKKYFKPVPTHWFPQSIHSKPGACTGQMESSSHTTCPRATPGKQQLEATSLGGCLESMGKERGGSQPNA